MKLLLLLALASAFATNCWAENENDVEMRPLKFYCSATCKDGEKCTTEEPSEEEKKKMCDEGYAMDENGNCIPDDQCPHADCGENRVYIVRNRLTPFYCNGTEDWKKPFGPCPCKEGYAMDENGKCVSYKDCNTVQCNENGELTVARVYFEKKCGEEEGFEIDDLKMRCECKLGYVESATGNCVHLRECHDDLKSANRGEECDYSSSEAEVESVNVSRFENIVFYFDAAKKRCLGFKFLGCGGNANKFYRLNTCEQVFAQDLTAKEVMPTCPDDAGMLVMYVEKPFHNKTVSLIPNKPLLGRQCSDDFCPHGSSCHDDLQEGLSFCCELVG